MTSRCAVNLSGDHLVQLFCGHIDSVPLSKMAQGALATVAMVRPDLHPCYTALLQHIPHVLNNLYSNFSLLLLHEKIIESMAAMLKVHMHIPHCPRLPLSCPLTTLMRTGMNTNSRRS